MLRGILVFLLLFVGACDDSYDGSHLKKRVRTAPDSDEKKNDDGSRVPDGGAIIEAHWENGSRERTQWTVFTYDHLPESLIKKPLEGLSLICPKYPQLTDHEKRNFWTYLVSLMSFYESTHNPKLNYKESFKDSRGEFVVSRGLLQLSYESSLLYGCDLGGNEKNLNDVRTNLSCGFKIMDFWVKKHSRLFGRENDKWLGLARYWSIFRNSRKRDKIVVRLNRLDLCQF